MLTIRRLIWDPGNVAHIDRHSVTPDEVEQVCHGHPVTSVTHHDRLRVVGPTQAGRMLTVILDPEPEPDVYYPVTARPASRQECRRYQEVQGGEAL